VVGTGLGGLGDFAPPPEAEAKCEINVHFYVFLYKIWNLMNIRARLRECILQTYNTKKLGKFNGGGVWTPPNPLWVCQWFRQTGTVGTLDIGYLCLGPSTGVLLRGSGVLSPEKIVSLYMKNSAIYCILGRKIVLSTVHNALINTLTMGRRFHAFLLEKTVGLPDFVRNSNATEVAVCQMHFPFARY